MRRSINLTQPPHCYAGQVQTWKFIHIPSQDLPKGTRLRFDLCTFGRSIDWNSPTVDLKKGGDKIYLELPSKKIIEAKETWIADATTPVYEFTLPSKVKTEEPLAIFLGGYTPAGAKKESPSTIAAQTFVQRRRPFHLYIDPTGKGNFKEPELFQIDVRGNKLAEIKSLTPSHVVRNRRFDITIRFEDVYGNLTNYADDETLIEVSYSQQRNNLEWKLFVPETGFIILPNLYFNEEGIYRITLKNLLTGDTTVSSPIRCFHEDHEQLFWGLLHGESEKIDFMEEPDNCLRHFRDELSYNFFASSIFESELESVNEHWKKINQHLQEFNEEDRFITFSGVQSTSASPEQGLMHFLFQKDSRPPIRLEEQRASQLKKIYRTHQPKDFLAIPTFTASSEHGYNFSQHDRRFERVVEIYNAWGCSECSEKEGNPFPIKRSKQKQASMLEEGLIRGALNRGLRLGFVAGGLDDRAPYASYFESDQQQYSPGLTAVLSPSYARDSIFKALYERRCYATTGPRILLGFYLSQETMGSELNVQQKPGLQYNRHLHGTVAMQAPITYIEIIRNGELLKRFTPKEELDFEYGFDDSDPLDQIALKNEQGQRFCYYYLRAQQSDGHMAWSSPIWLDLDCKGGVTEKKSK